MGEEERKHNSIDYVFKLHPCLILCIDFPKYNMNLNINDISSKNYSTEIKGVAFYFSLYKVSPVMGNLFNYTDVVLIVEV